MQYLSARTKSRSTGTGTSSHPDAEGSSSAPIEDFDSADHRPRKHKDKSNRPLTLEDRVIIEQFFGGGSTRRIRKDVEASQARKEAKRQRAAGIANVVATGVESSVTDAQGIHYRDEAERDEFQGLRSGRNVHFGGRSRSAPRAGTPSDDERNSFEDDFSAPPPAVTHLGRGISVQHSDASAPDTTPMRRGRPPRPKTAGERTMKASNGGASTASASFFSDSFVPSAVTHPASTGTSTGSSTGVALPTTLVPSLEDTTRRRRRGTVQSLLVEPTSPVLADLRSQAQSPPMRSTRGEVPERQSRAPLRDDVPSTSSSTAPHQHSRLRQKHSTNSLVSSLSIFTKKLTSRDSGK